jgi:hypothetical protein
VSDTATAPTIDERIEKIIDEWLPESDFVVAIEAEKLRARLEETEPELLDQWLHENVARFLANEIGLRLRSQRSTTQGRAAARAFDAAAKEAEKRPTASKRIFAVTYAVDKDDTRKSVGEMTGADHLFVAGHREVLGNRLKFEAAFHRAVAKVVGKRKTSEVMTEEQYTELYRKQVDAR